MDNNQSMALIKICKDLLEHKKRDTKILFVVLIVSIITNFAVVGAFLLYESGWEYSDSVTTTTEQSIDSKKDGNIVNGNQYNDRASEVINNGGKTKNKGSAQKNKNKKKK